MNRDRKTCSMCSAAETGNRYAIAHSCTHQPTHLIAPLQDLPLLSLNRIYTLYHTQMYFGGSSVYVIHTVLHDYALAIILL